MRQAQVGHFTHGATDLELLSTNTVWARGLEAPFDDVVRTEGFRLDCLANAALVRIALRAQQTAEVQVSGAHFVYERAARAKLFGVNALRPEMHQIRDMSEPRMVKYAPLLTEWAQTFESRATGAAKRIQRLLVEHPQSDT